MSLAISTRYGLISTPSIESRCLEAKIVKKPQLHPISKAENFFDRKSKKREQVK